MSELKNTYRISLSRKDLDQVIEHFADAGLADVLVDECGEIIFNIKRTSSLKIKPYYPHQKLGKEILKIKKRLDSRSKLRLTDKVIKNLELKLAHYESALKLLKD
jgi:hypothetical protein